MSSLDSTVLQVTPNLKRKDFQLRITIFTDQHVVSASLLWLPEALRVRRRVLPFQVFVFVQVLEKGGLADQLCLLTHLFTRLTQVSLFDLQSAEGRPHDLTVAEVLRKQNKQLQFF